MPNFLIEHYFDLGDPLYELYTRYSIFSSNHRYIIVLVLLLSIIFVQWYSKNFKNDIEDFNYHTKIICVINVLTILLIIYLISYSNYTLRFFNNIVCVLIILIIIFTLIYKYKKNQVSFVNWLSGNLISILALIISLFSLFYTSKQVVLQEEEGNAQFIVNYTINESEILFDIINYGSEITELSFSSNHFIHLGITDTADGYRCKGIYIEDLNHIEAVEEKDKNTWSINVHIPTRTEFNSAIENKYWIRDTSKHQILLIEYRNKYKRFESKYFYIENAFEGSKGEMKLIDYENINRFEADFEIISEGWKEDFLNFLDINYDSIEEEYSVF